MTQSISPLDDTLIRFDAAASFLANREPCATPNAVLEMLVRAASSHVQMPSTGGCGRTARLAGRAARARRRNAMITMAY